MRLFEIVIFATAEELERKGFPQDIAEGQSRYLMNRERVEVVKHLGALYFYRLDAETGEWKVAKDLPIDTKNIFAPNAKEIRAQLPLYSQAKLTMEQERDQDVEGYAVLWMEENDK